ncbi:hypothetical protein EYF80_060523 [Liparis tanakae]|uniref:Uncharacterized protein n=1 Tax=Liparis tanakae TaxID=230148 RepID=A0A4Z2EKU3_9TELE|nr:hypothetical protein EYF80_060523 [Liparis tanakae]
MITNTLARVLFTAESTSANTTAPWTAGGAIAACYLSTRPTPTRREGSTHAQEDDSSDPELDPEQIPPVARRQGQPQHGQQHDEHVRSVLPGLGHHVQMKRSSHLSSKDTSVTWFGLFMHRMDTLRAAYYNSYTTQPPNPSDVAEATK